jgi:hypothetical protein
MAVQTGLPNLRSPKGPSSQSAEPKPTPGRDTGLHGEVSCPDEEQPARHGSALAADRRRAWNSLANVALLRLLLLCQEVDG